MRFGQIADFSAGRTPSRHDFSFWNTGDYSWVSIADLKDGGDVLATKETISEKAKNQIFGSEPAPVGTLIMSFKLTIGKISRLGIPAFHNEAIISIHPHLPEMDPYLFKVLPQFSRQGDTKDAVKGATLNRDSITNIFLPLPPLAEQHRIVAKVDELMALCDRLETAKYERETRRDRLSAASHHHLNNGEDAEIFRRHATFYINHLQNLTSHPAHLQQHRQTILNLAVRGQLVPQDSNDEPASFLLTRLMAETRAYAREQNIASPKPEPIKEERLPHPAPKGWIWTRLSGLFKVITDGDHQPPPKAEDGIAFLTIGNITTGCLNFSNCRFVPQSYLESLANYRKPSHGDILYTVVGATYGRPALVNTNRPFCVQRHIAILKPTSEVDIKFICLLLASPMVYEQATRSTTGAAQPTIPLRPLRNFLVLLPPLTEQHRIVAKVDELMAICDRLEAQLTTAQAETGRLLEAVVQRTLAEDRQEEQPHRHRQQSSGL